MTPAELQDLAHDVKSKCGSLTGAASLLSGSAEAERRELLALMAKQARSLYELLEKAAK